MSSSSLMSTHLSPGTQNDPKQLFLPLVFVLLTGKLLGTFVFVLNVTLHLLAPCLGVAISFVLAIPSTLSLVASIFHGLCWICCLHVYLKLFQILHICDLLPHCLRPLLKVLCILPDMYCPMIAVVLSTTPTIVSAMVLGAICLQIHARSLCLCRLLSTCCMAYQLWGDLPMPMSFLFWCLACAYCLSFQTRCRVG